MTNKKGGHTVVMEKEAENQTVEGVEVTEETVKPVEEQTAALATEEVVEEQPTKGKVERDPFEIDLGSDIPNIDFNLPEIDTGL